MEITGLLLWLRLEVRVRGCPSSEVLAEILTQGRGTLSWDWGFLKRC